MLISTYILCGYTHQTDHSPKLTPTKYPLRPHTLITSAQSYPSNGHCYPQMHTKATYTLHSSNYSPLIPSKLPQPLSLHQVPPLRSQTTPISLHQAPPPRSQNTPNEPWPPPSPTQHHKTPTKVSKITCTYHMLTQAQKHQKTRNRLSIILPSKVHSRSKPLCSRKLQQVSCQTLPLSNTRHSHTAEAHNPLVLKTAHTTETPNYKRQIDPQTKRPPAKHTHPWTTIQPTLNPSNQKTPHKLIWHPPTTPNMLELSLA